MTKKYIHPQLPEPVELPFTIFGKKVTTDEEALEFGFIEAPKKEYTEGGFGGAICEKPVDKIDTEEKGDWIDNVVDYLENHEGNWDWSELGIRQLKKAINICMPKQAKKHKPVEQELVPLDVEAIKNDILQGMIYGKISWDIPAEEREKNIETILSKYGVPKQEDRYPTNPFVGVGGVGASTKDIDLIIPTTQATSVIDVEEVAKRIEDIMYYKIEKFTADMKQVPYKRKHLQDILSSLPIQKKRTREEIKAYFMYNSNWRDSYETGKIAGAEIILSHIGLLSE